MKSILAVIISLSGFSAQASDCQQLKADLQKLLKVQSQILTSLNSNHETAASSLEEYAQLIKSSKGSGEGKIASLMNQSATSFRQRGLQGKQIATSLNKETAELIEELLKCLK
jgi:hypothetical protein